MQRPVTSSAVEKLSGEKPSWWDAETLPIAIGTARQIVLKSVALTHTRRVNEIRIPRFRIDVGSSEGQER